MVWLTGLNPNPGKAFRILLLSKFTFCCAVSAVSFVSNASLPVIQLLILSMRHTMAARVGLTFLEGGFYTQTCILFQSIYCL